MARFFGFRLGIRIGLATAIGLAASACGNSPSALKSSATSPSSSDSASVTSSDAYEKLDWYFQCPTDPFPVPPPVGPSAVVLEGAGPHRLSRERMVGVPVTIRGRLCAPAQLPRDIVFVVDTSGSMALNDRFDGTTCNRAKALSAVVGMVPASMADFGIVTFGDAVGHASSALAADGPALIADVTGNRPQDFAGAICMADYGTQYTPALAKAAEILATGRVGASKEIYLITDGQPTDQASSEALASQLKTSGVVIDGQAHPVTIAAVSLGSRPNDLYLKQSIASWVPTSADDATLAPLYAHAEAAADLADVLARLAANGISQSSIHHGPDSQPDAHVIDLMSRLDTGHNFATDPFVLAIDSAQQGYAVKLGYGDRRGGQTDFRGLIEWVD